MYELFSWSNTKNVRGLGYWGLESKNHDNIYWLLTQGSLCMCGVIIEAVSYWIQHGLLYQLSKDNKRWFNWMYVGILRLAEID